MDAFSDPVKCPLPPAKHQPESTQEQQQCCEDAAQQKQHVVVLTPVQTFHRRILAPHLAWFNADQDRARLLLSVLTGDTPLRLIDHMVVQYSRTREILVTCNKTPVELWTLYRRLLKSNKKVFFDCYKRCNLVRIKVCGTTVDAAVSQVVFFQWYFSSDLHLYMQQYREEIRAHMKECEVQFRSRKTSDRVRTCSKTSSVKATLAVHPCSLRMEFC